MRVHPISLALQYLKGKRAWHAAPYRGGAPFRNEAEAVATLKRFTGRDFGNDAKAWGAWLRANRAAYHRDVNPGSAASVGGTVSPGRDVETAVETVIELLGRPAPARRPSR